MVRPSAYGWLAECAGLLEPIVKAMARRVLASRVIGTDDTPVTVQDHGGKGAKTRRLWAYLGDRDNPFVVFDYTADRSRDGPERFLADYRRGYLQSDAFPGYDRVHGRGIVEVGCWAHARRKFYDARTSDPERSHAAIAWVGRLYEVEREAREDSWGDDRLMEARRERSRPLLESFWGWLDGEAEGAAEEPGGRGDRLHPVEPGCAVAVPGGALPGDRQQCGREPAAADRSRATELAAPGQRPGGAGPRPC